MSEASISAEAVSSRPLALSFVQLVHRSGGEIHAYDIELQADPAFRRAAEAALSLGYVEFSEGTVSFDDAVFYRVTALGLEAAGLSTPSPTPLSRFGEWVGSLFRPRRRP